MPLLSACGGIQGNLSFTWTSPSLGTLWSHISLSPVPGPGTVDSQGQIEFLRCFATLKTKSQTKFYLEFHSSCLESKWVPSCYLLAVQAGLFFLGAFSLVAPRHSSLWEGFTDGPHGGLQGERWSLWLLWGHPPAACDPAVVASEAGTVTETLTRRQPLEVTRPLAPLLAPRV